ncbi:sigma-70 family RNA polymerase sigma factor [Aetokthonos hydrillicola Thurmond2011]|jgi:DNA-directed RNA polymerase specialized sigma24 family protein|uniref:Sigma-70 family RNA polymerase sigma factor n=1 Tax=Aetokthonos hydrillicola Thurmond2011 TaxID=2712845 RepID=A0AAP5IH86_9CYAN|nr:sigma-70 family RNA polymerase sigma factor [Aetokthonos hydrillicola]MBO3459548.1 sigma-70 family RNA polymerase sigma factor [Aetokthonos hydrillicola CCALA 1050]MBW4590297.1 sigma-70 family RNA polymerase sigma factor [Aetokthonos hydrillicola CCALA 1050]MDR9899415.1 sigma-70 family RNA polymerase sigma factor [Aetokthonos hydrillicola Thurmond2011]
MNEQELQQLALQAQKHTLGTTVRRITLSKLIDGIYRSGKLCYPYKGQFQGVYEQIYKEAVQDLLLYICKNIDKYDPERGKFITWINMLLSQRFFKEAIPKIIGSVNEIRVETARLEDLEGLAFAQSEDEEDYTSAFEKIRRHIEEDTLGIFREEHIKKYPQANFREIAIKRWSGVSWKDISDELKIPIPTLSNFYQRCLEKFRDELKNVCGFET